MQLSFAVAAGTTVSLYPSFEVPAAKYMPSATVDQEQEDRASKPVILIVEDNPELNEFLTQAFHPCYSVLRAADGARGWELAQQELPDVIISDWMMPGMDGHAFCQAVKSHLATGHIAFIMLTAKAASASRLEALQSRADDYIAKPFVVEELQLRVANLLERQHCLRNKLLKELGTPGTDPGQKHNTGNAPEDDIFIKKVHAVLEEHLDEPGFGVVELAAGLYMSRASLHRKIKAVSDHTPTMLIRNYRLKRAAQFLKQGFNSSEAAYKAGFDSTAYFSKCFHEFYQTTPTDFIRQHSEP